MILCMNACILTSPSCLILSGCALLFSDDNNIQGRSVHNKIQISYGLSYVLEDCCAPSLNPFRS